MKANSEAAKKRLARLNQEYQVRQKVRQISKAKPKHESFGEAAAKRAGNPTHHLKEQNANRI